MIKRFYILTRGQSLTYVARANTLNALLQTLGFGVRISCSHPIKRRVSLPATSFGGRTDVGGFEDTLERLGITLPIKSQLNKRRHLQVVRSTNYSRIRVNRDHELTARRNCGGPRALYSARSVPSSDSYHNESPFAYYVSWVTLPWNFYRVCKVYFIIIYIPPPPKSIRKKTIISAHDQQPFFDQSRVRWLIKNKPRNTLYTYYSRGRAIISTTVARASTMKTMESHNLARSCTRRSLQHNIVRVTYKKWIKSVYLEK